MGGGASKPKPKASLSQRSPDPPQQPSANQPSSPLHSSQLTTPVHTDTQPDAPIPAPAVTNDAPAQPHAAPAASEDQVAASEADSSPCAPEVLNNVAQRRTLPALPPTQHAPEHTPLLSKPLAPIHHTPPKTAGPEGRQDDAAAHGKPAYLAPISGLDPGEPVGPAHSTKLPALSPIPGSSPLRIRGNEDAGIPMLKAPIGKLHALAPIPVGAQPVDSHPSGSMNGSPRKDRPPSSSPLPVREQAVQPAPKANDGLERPSGAGVSALPREEGPATCHAASHEERSSEQQQPAAQICFLLGGPGSGTTTMGARLARKYGLTHVCLDELIRLEVTRGSSVGREMGKLVSEGKLIPMLTLVKLLVSHIEKTGHHVIDGFPRTLEDLELFWRTVRANQAQHDFAIWLDAPQAVRSERLLARGASRDKRFSEHPQRTTGDFEAGDDLTEMIARKDGPQELGRENFVHGATSVPVSSRTEGERYPEQADESTHTQGKDNPDTIRTRQAAYQAREDSLIEYLQLRLLVTKVDASLCVEDVFRAVCDAFESRQQQPRVQEGVAF